MRSFVRYLNRNRKAIHSIIHAERDIEFVDRNDKAYTIGVEVALQYTDVAITTELAFTNTINTPDGGTHITGLRSAITGVINRYARKAGLLKEKDGNFSGNDTLEGLTAIVSVKHPRSAIREPNQGQAAQSGGAGRGIAGWSPKRSTNTWRRIPATPGRIVDKCMTSKRAREAAKKARDLVRSGPSLLESSTLPGKLADCSTRGDSAEIYIVEGDSAGGSAKQGRDRALPGYPAPARQNPQHRARAHRQNPGQQRNQVADIGAGHRHP